MRTWRSVNKVEVMSQVIGQSINRTATHPFWNVLPNPTQILLPSSIGRTICPRNSKYIRLPSCFGGQAPEPTGLSEAHSSLLSSRNLQARVRLSRGAGEPPHNKKIACIVVCLGETTQEPPFPRYLNQSKILCTSA